MEGRVAVLGDRDFVKPFAALGIDTYAVAEGNEQVRSTATAILGKKYTMVIVAESVARAADEVFAEKDKEATPCVVIVPFTTESTGYATESLAAVLKLATGVSILDKK